MDPERLTGFVYPVKKNGVPVRGRWQLWVNLPSEPAFDRDGQPVLDSKGRQKQRYPKTTKVVEATGKKAAERLLETWIAELESHRTIDPDRLKLAELLGRTFPADFATFSQLWYSGPAVAEVKSLQIGIMPS